MPTILIINVRSWIWTLGQWGIIVLWWYIMNQSFRCAPASVLASTCSTALGSWKPMLTVWLLVYNRNYILCKLQKIVFLFYPAVPESIIQCRMSVWYGNLTIQLENKLAPLVQTAIKFMGKNEHQSLQSIFEQRSQANTEDMVWSITYSPCHLWALALW